jgi:hypothetical protein
MVREKRRRYDGLDWLVVALVGLAAVIRFAHLGDIVLYWDEPLHSVRIAAQSLGFVAAHNDGSALFAMLVHFLLGLGGSIEVLSRLPSAVCGHVAVLFAYRLGREMLSRQAGVLAALFIVFSPTLIQYSQYSRMYGTYSFFSLLTLYLFYRAVTEDRTGLWAGYGAATAANLYNHVLGFFVLPVFGLFTLGLWLAESLARRGKESRPFRSGKVLRFTLWTLCGIVAAALLYIPDKRIQYYLLDSVGRAVETTPSPASFSILKTVLLEHLRPVSPFLLWALLGLAALGFLLSLKKHRREAVLSLLYLSLPFTIFVLIRPNAVTFYSAPRYFLIFLPLLFLYMGFALWKGAALLAGGFHRRYRPAGRPSAAAFPISVALTLVVTFAASDIKGYYWDYWRLGTYAPPADVSGFLRQNLKEGCFFLADTFPAAAMSLAAEPLTRDLKVEEIEHLFLPDRKTKPGGNRTLLSRIDLAALRLYPRYDAPVLAALAAPPARSEALKALLASTPGLSLLRGEGDSAFLFHPRDGTPFFRKVITVTEALLRLDPPAWRRRLLHWHTAQACLLGGLHEESLAHIRSARALEGPDAAHTGGAPPLDLRLLDRLFGLTPGDFLPAAERLHLKENIARLLLMTGNRLAARDQREEAFRVFRACAEISPSYGERCSGRITDMAVWLFGHGRNEKSLPLFDYAAANSPERVFARFLALEALKRAGRGVEARDRAEGLFPGLASLERERAALLGESPGLFLWREGGRLHAFFRAPRGTRLRGRILGVGGTAPVQSRWIRRADELTPGEGAIGFSFRMDGTGIKAFAVPLKGKKTIEVAMEMDGRPAPEAVVFLN